MNHESDFDHIRSLVEGRLEAGARADLEARIAADPELREFHEAYLAIHALTAPLAAETATSSLDFDDLNAPSSAPAPILRFARAAAAVLLLAVGVYAGVELLAPSGPATVRLGAIELAAATVEGTSPVALPAVAATYDSAKDGRINWLDSLEEGRRMGRLSGRPVLVFSEFPGCPFCVEMEATSFRNAEVLELIADIVPIKLDLSKMPESEWRWYWERYPYFGVQDVEGNEIYTFPGMQKEDSLRRHLALAVEKTADIGPRLPWNQVRTLSATFDRALAAEHDGRLDEACKAYEQLTEADVSSLFFDEGKAGEARIGAAAASSLVEARELASSDVDAATRRLDEAVSLFDGTPYADDLSATRDALRERNRFPVLIGPAGEELR